MANRLSGIIIEEHADWIAVNKPAGLLSIPDREGKEVSLKQLLREKYGEILTVHRLDKETSGLILFARNEESHKILNRQFEERLTKKIYLGLLLGTPTNLSGTVNVPIAEHPARNGSMIVHRNGKEAITDYRVLEDFRKYSWTEFRIHTGRTHQIRVHMKSIGHPLFNDPEYGGDEILRGQNTGSYRQFVKNCFEILPRQALHAKTLGIIHPATGERMVFDSELPADMQAVIAKFRGIQKS